MSSLIGIIQGKVEIPIPQKRESKYYPQTMFITRFYGGDGRGTCLQINIGNSHIQISEKEIKELADTITKWKEVQEKDDY